MHAIAEEDEEDEAQAPKKPMLSVRNGMPEVDSDDEIEARAEVKAAPRPALQSTPKAAPESKLAEPATFSDSEDDDEDGEEVEFGLDDGIWEMVESKPTSTHAPLAQPRESVTVVGIQDNSRHNSRVNSRSPSISADHSRDSSLQSSRSNSTSAPSSSRGSRGSMYFGPGAFARDSTPDAPPMPPVPVNLTDAELHFPKPPSGTTPKPKTPEPAANRPKIAIPAQAPVTAYGPPGEKWGKGLGVEFGIAY
jgi:hypothetical protein